MLSPILNPRWALLALLASSATDAFPVDVCPTPLTMGVASNFAALAHSTLTSTGNSVLTGDAGVYAGTAITGFPPGIVTGNMYSATPESQNGKGACQSAYIAGHGRAADATLLASELGGQTLNPGVYTFASAAKITGTLTLSGSGPLICGGGQFIFLIPTTLITNSAAAIVLATGAKACNVYFLVGTSATLGAGSNLRGNIIASASISGNAAAGNVGTLCALNGGITLINNKLTSQGRCA